MGEYMTKVALGKVLQSGSNLRLDLESDLGARRRPTR
jgi:hypothetical protein